ncbi:MAG: type IV secretion system protein [Gemmatimonadota bacterium]|nr:type IV secretion system protein [Deltaproteobacteria bacterium]MDE2973688.1 type IV secretion system protein [Gemmatimonadota bacterium]
MQPPAYQSIDSTVPTNIPDSQIHDFKPFLDQVQQALVGTAAPEILATGEALWRGFAIVVVVWKGLQIAYSGTFQPWDLVRTVIGLWIPWIMLHFYDTDIIAGYTFPGAIVGGGSWLQNYFLADLGAAWGAEINNLSETLNASIAAQWEDMNVLKVLTGAVHLILTAGVMTVMGLTILVCMVALYAITYAQVIWAQIAIAILLLLGPIFIAMLVFSPLSFLFWGWFRALLTYSLYGAIAGAVMRVFLGVGLGYVTTFAQSTADLNSITNLGKWTMALLPLLIAGLLASLKVGELASMLVSGGGAAGSGFMSMAATAATGGASKAAAAAKVAG